MDRRWRWRNQRTGEPTVRRTGALGWLRDLMRAWRAERYVAFTDWLRQEGLQTQLERAQVRIQNLFCRLPSFVIDEGFEAKKCSICMEHTSEGDELRTLPCFHMFHKACVDPWLRDRESCPICKEKVICDPEDE